MCLGGTSLLSTVVLVNHHTGAFGPVHGLGHVLEGFGQQCLLQGRHHARLFENPEDTPGVKLD